MTRTTVASFGKVVLYAMFKIFGQLLEITSMVNFLALKSNDFGFVAICEKLSKNI